MSGFDIDVCVFDELWRCQKASARFIAARLDMLMGVPLDALARPSVRS